MIYIKLAIPIDSLFVVACTGVTKTEAQRHSSSNKSSEVIFSKKLQTIQIEKNILHFVNNDLSYMAKIPTMTLN